MFICTRWLGITSNIQLLTFNDKRRRNDFMENVYIYVDLSEFLENND